jgi:flagellin-like protein
MDKRGLSPVIATVLLIALVLVLASIIFLWMKGFVSEQVMKSIEGSAARPVQQICDEISFDANIVFGGASAYDLEIRNTGNVNLYSFDVKKIMKNGDSKIENFRFPVDVGQAISKPFNYEEGNVKKLIIYPMLLGNVKDKKLNKMYTCIDKGKTLTLD